MLDSVGRTLAQVNALGCRTTFSYDARQQVIGLLNPFAEQTTISYDGLGRELHKVVGNGMTVSHSYDAAGRELLLENRDATGVGLAIYTTSYDAAGNPLAGQQLAGGAALTFSYDATGQLVNEQRSGTDGFRYNRTFAYDGTGNQVLRIGTSGALTTNTFNGADQLVLVQTGGGVYTYNYDSNGNVSYDGLRQGTLTWDDENRLATDSAVWGIQTHTYAADGQRRMRQTSDGHTYQFVWDEANLLLWTDVTGATQNRYTEGPGAWGGLVSEHAGSSSRYYAFDPAGNTRLLVNPDGTPNYGQDYSAWGQIALGYLYGGATQAPYLPHGYRGQYGYFYDRPGYLGDDWTGRLYVRARHLDPSILLRWLSPDPLGLGGGDGNLYRYVGNRPTVGVDPSGLLTVSCYLRCIRNSLTFAIAGCVGSFTPCAYCVLPALVASVVTCLASGTGVILCIAAIPEGASLIAGLCTPLCNVGLKGCLIGALGGLLILHFACVGFANTSDCERCDFHGLM